MSRKSRGIAVWAVTLVMVVATDVGAQPTPEIRWDSDAVGALQRAKAAHKPALVLFTAAWCRPCGRLERETFTDPDIQQELGRLVTIKVDATDSTTVAGVLDRFQVDEFPTLVFVSASGEELAGSRVGGFVGPETLLAWLKKGRGGSAGARRRPRASWTGPTVVLHSVPPLLDSVPIPTVTSAFTSAPKDATARTTTAATSRERGATPMSQRGLP